MSNLINQNWIGLDGKPVTGRVPPSIRMMAGVMTPVLMAEVAHRYQLFCLNKQAAVGDFFVSDRTLPDGSRVRIVSNMGVDVVMVWSKYGPPTAELDHGLAVFADWMAAPLHRRKTGGAISFAARALQVSGPDVTYGHSTLIPSGKGPDGSIFYPMVNGGTKEMWGLWKHKGNEGGKDGAMPLLLEYRGGKGVYAFVKGRKLLSAAGDTLYDMPDIPPRNPGEASTPKDLPHRVSGDGRLLALAQRRVVEVSPTFNRWNFLYGFQLLERKSGVFTLKGGIRSGNLTAPLVETTTYVEGGDAGIDESVTGRMWTKTLTPVPPGPASWSFNHDGLTSPTIPVVIVGFEWVDYEGSRPIVAGQYAIRQDTASSEDALVEGIPVPTNVGMETCVMTSRLNYPVTALWQGGMRGVELDAETYTGYGVIRKRKIKRNTEWKIDAKPSIDMWLPGYGSFSMFEGSVLGVLDGHKHETILERINPYVSELSDNGSFFAPFPPESGYSNGYVGQKVTLNFPPDFGGDATAAYAWAKTNAINFYAIVAGNPPTNDVDEDLLPPRAHGSYTYTSRHIIDFDSRIGLLVAILVEVQCAGAKWRQKEGSYLGHLIEEVRPTYRVKIALDWTVTKPDGQKLGGIKTLHESTFVRPAIEFTFTVKENVLRWPAPESEFAQLIVPMPPCVSPDPDAYYQLDNLGNHQAVSPHFAGADVTQPGQAISADGYEASTLQGAVINPHKKKPCGTLYARTICPAEHADSLWLLRRLKIDAIEIGKSPFDEPPPPPWFYAPQVLEAINRRYRLELTEDGEVNWTDLVPAKPGTAKPKLIDRDIKTFYV